VLGVDLSTGDALASGVVRRLSDLTLIAALIGILYKGPGEGVLHLAAVALVLVDSLSGLLLFNKLAAFKPWLMLFCGLYLRHMSTKWIAVGTGTVILGMTMLAQPILDARGLLGNSNDTSLFTRIAILQQSFQTSEGTGDSEFGVWSRLCYTPVQWAAVRLYETGAGGEDIESLGWVFLPRALFPEKPNVSRSAAVFNKKLTGDDSSNMGMGPFVNGYYNLGWGGLLLTSALTGLILATFAAVSRAIVVAGSALLLPVALLGSYVAFRVDGDFVTDYVGVFAMVMVPLLMLIFVMQRVRGRRRSGHGFADRASQAGRARNGATPVL
jgi:hypothetical protein